MDRVVIFFIGLIVHMDLMHSTTAVLVRAPGHAYTMTIFRSNGKIDSRDITDTMITVNRSSNLQTIRSGIKHRIPELKDIAPTCQPRAAIQNRDPDGFVAAYVDYEGGKLKAFDAEKSQVHFQHGTVWKPCHCTACRVELDLNVPMGGSVTITVAPIADKKSVKNYFVSNDDVVVFRDAGAGTGSDDHSHIVFDLLDDGAGNKCPVSDPVETKDCPSCTGGSNCGSPTATLAALRKANKSGMLVFPFWTTLSKKEKDRLVTTIVVPSVDCSDSQYP